MEHKVEVAIDPQPDDAATLLVTLLPLWLTLPDAGRPCAYPVPKGAENMRVSMLDSSALIENPAARYEVKMVRPGEGCVWGPHTVPLRAGSKRRKPKQEEQPKDD